jgi:glycosyltransferase involved in cell wall biosynthesis
VIHDTTPFANPHLLGIKAQLIYRTSARVSLKRAKSLICDSAYTRLRMQELFPALGSKLKVIPCCLAPKFSYAGSEAYRRLNSVNVETVHGVVSLPQPFILHVGVAGPRKNVPALIASFHEVKLRMFPHRLVLVGGHAKPLPKQSRPLPQVALPDGSTMQPVRPLPDVLHLGPVSDDDLIALYRHADLVVLPSLEEGFGYPVLEALAFRTPALTARDSPLADLPGVALIPDVRNPATIAAELEDALRRLPELASQLSSDFSLDYYSCERYLRDILSLIS